MNIFLVYVLSNFNQVAQKSATCKGRCLLNAYHQLANFSYSYIWSVGYVRTSVYKIVGIYETNHSLLALVKLKFSDLSKITRWQWWQNRWQWWQNVHKQFVYFFSLLLNQCVIPGVKNDKQYSIWNFIPGTKNDTIWGKLSCNCHLFEFKYWLDYNIATFDLCTN